MSLVLIYFLMTRNTTFTKAYGQYKNACQKSVCKGVTSPSQRTNVWLVLINTDIDQCRLTYEESWWTRTKIRHRWLFGTEIRQCEASFGTIFIDLRRTQDLHQRAPELGIPISYSLPELCPTRRRHLKLDASARPSLDKCDAEKSSSEAPLVVLNNLIWDYEQSCLSYYWWLTELTIYLYIQARPVPLISSVLVWI